MFCMCMHMVGGGVGIFFNTGYGGGEQGQNILGGVDYFWSKEGWRGSFFLDLDGWQLFFMPH